MTIINGRPATRMQELRISVAYYHGYLDGWLDKQPAQTQPAVLARQMGWLKVGRVSHD